MRQNKMLLKFSFFLFVVLTTALPQDSNSYIQNEINKITQDVKTKLLSKETSSLTIDNDEDQDGAIRKFLTTAMENYPTWLAKEDPLTPDPAEIILNTTVVNDDDLADLDAILKISNQYMADHSKPGRTVVNTASEAGINLFSAGRMVYDGVDAIYGGDYVVSGSLKVSETLKIPFSGQGKMTIKSNELTEILTTRYVVNENGYVDIPIIDVYVYSIMAWNQIEFQGLRFDYNENIDPAWMPNLIKLLAELYNTFLFDRPVLEQFAEHNAPKRLLKTYLQEVFKSTKLEDIVSGSQTTTKESTASTDIDPTSPPDTGNGNTIIGSFWIFILTLGTVCLYY